MRNTIFIVFIGLIGLASTTRAQEQNPIEQRIARGEEPTSYDCGPCINITPQDGGWFISIFDSNGSEPSRQCNGLFHSLEEFVADQPTFYSQYVRDCESPAKPRVNIAAAWQIFAREYDPPQNLLDEFNAIVPRLDSEKWREREKATRELDDVRFVPLLLTVDRTKLNPEQNARIDSLLYPIPKLSPSQLCSLRENRQYLNDLSDVATGDLKTLVDQELASGPE